MQKKRILFFPDRFSGELSGAISARSTLKSLLELGHTVALFTVDADKIIDYKGFENVVFYKINSLMRANSHFLEPKLEIQFKKILDDFMPEYYFMAGSIQKPSRLAEIARSEGVKNIFLFYITDYYCSKTYAGLENGPCYKCIDIGISQALKNNCIKGNFKYINFLKSLLVRKKLKSEILKSHRVAGYSENQLEIYRKFGVNKSKLRKISLQFDPEELDEVSSKDGDYFLILGQPSIEKGFHTISEILKECKSKLNVKIVFKDLMVKERAIKDFNLSSFIENGIISTNIGLSKRDEVIKLIANSKAVLIPSYYPTTGEFVLIESLILGKPVLVFNSGAHQNFIKHKINGMVSQIGDFKSFSKNIDEINTNKTLREKLSKGSKDLISELLSKKYMLTSLNELFKE